MALSFVFVGNVEAGKGLAQNLVAAGFPAAERVESADVIISLCSHQSQREDLFYDEGGIISSAMPGAYIIDCSPTTPTSSKELSAIATVNDFHMIEAPLVVKDPTISDAYGDPMNLVALAAGDEDDIQAVGALLHAMASTVQVCGAAGEGELAKCAITIQQCAQLAALMEADALCRVSSSPATASAMIALASEQQLVSPAVRWIHDAIRREDFGSGNAYSVEMLWGELEAALAAADDMDLIMPQAEAALYLLELLATIGGISLAPAALKLIYSDDSVVAKHGLDWKRAEQAYSSMGYSEDEGYYEDFDGEGSYDGYDDDDYHHDHDGHDHGFGIDFDGDFRDWSSN